MEICPLCGYNEKRASKVEHTIMHNYINKDNPKDVCVMNCVLPEVKHADGKVFIRADLYGKTPAAPKVPSSPIIQQQNSSAPIVPANTSGTPTIPAAPATGWPTAPNQP